MPLSRAGLEASLFAAEPMVPNPTNIEIDPRSRVWAIEEQIAGSRGTPRFIALIRDFHLEKGQAPALLAAALKNQQDPLANEALKLIFADPDSENLIAAALAGPQAATMIAMLGSNSDRRATAMLAATVTSSNLETTRVEAVKSFASSILRKVGARDLRLNNAVILNRKAPLGEISTGHFQRPHPSKFPLHSPPSFCIKSNHENRF